MIEQSKKNTAIPEAPVNGKSVPVNGENPRKKLIEKARKVLRGEWMDTAELTTLVRDLADADQFAYAADVLLLKMDQQIAEGNQVNLIDHQSLARFIYKDHSLPSTFKFKRAMQELSSHDELLNSNNCETLGLTGAIYKNKWLYDQQRRNLELSAAYYLRGYECWKNWLRMERPEQLANQQSNDNGHAAINYAYMLELKAIHEIDSIGDQTDVLPRVKELFTEAGAVRTYVLNQFLESAYEEIRDNLEALKMTKEDDYGPWVYATMAEAFFGLRKYEAAQHYLEIYTRKEKEASVAGQKNKIVDEKAVAWKMRVARKQLFSMAFNQQRLLTWASKHMKVKKFVGSPVATQPVGSANTGAGGEQESLSLAEEMKSAVQSIAYAELIEGISQKKFIRTLLAFNPKTKRDSVRPTISEIKRKGKVGLALSGGGFRAALFHIGVLASLAERDMLKEVEVISCVSGGSIIGAYYYLHLKHLLEHSKDHDITREDYIKLVKDIEKHFLEGVQKNLRMQVLTNPWCNLKMIFSSNYSRTHRLGELYEQHLFTQIKGLQDRKEIFMTDLFIQPEKYTEKSSAEGEEKFSIATDNVGRVNKVPQLILNATSVNTGHNWQFTASWMGEPPGSIQPEIDVKPRLRRMYYEDAPEEFQKIRLGYAVGASSCVPVMFTPLPMKGLYPGIDLELVDGGVHDNQGIAALLEQECSNMIISDASGQMATSQKGESNELQMFYRADTILQERIRELQFRDLNERQYSSMLSNLLTIHLKSDLQQPPLKWKNCTDPSRTLFDKIEKEDDNDLTNYGIIRKVQQQLSEVRTDLDSFNNTEAYALMYSGYRQMHYELDRRNVKEKGRSSKWDFLQITEYLTNPEKAEKVSRPLSVASKVPLKVFHLNRTLFYSIRILSALAVAALCIIGYRSYTEEYILLEDGISITGKDLLFSMITVVGGFVLTERISKYLKVKSWIRKRAALLIGSMVMCLVCNLYILSLNKLYNKSGELPRQPKPKK